MWEFNGVVHCLVLGFGDVVLLVELFGGEGFFVVYDDAAGPDFDFLVVG